ncbi:MAG TPA: chromosomal replication initiator protein DnaA [Candidatus Merdicola faecigallinarum]|uniref:Chromosomal replication initiator protein DnaA n=1 Tax=Candidatus Merdicola faecigallinarum TaxID=2840862 RepID=A0A9D1M2G8_9FIRM|nr:chromosomal replication initiator protein DnaA [Candidatus Merdicola faecigallinarum]
MQSELNELLTKAKDLLKNEMTNISYETWIKNLEIEDFTNDKIVLVATSTFQKDAVETRYYDLVLNTFKFITNKDCKIVIVCKNDSISSNSNNSQIEENKNENSFNDNTNGYSNSFLNPKYTFDTFVVGNNNRFAHAASLAVAEAPATSYNPLFLYGGVGLGKTHLMHAIGNEILKNNKNANILYVTSEKFTNQLINAIRDNKNEQFRNRYRNIDVLLIDDIQFIAGKERIQEEFFHTFNSLHESGKQIIISSDRPPKDIQLLEDRLKSRFEWGLIADISNPDYETRLAILRKKAQTDNIIVDDEILSNIATRVSSNIRELEGVFNKIVAFSTLANGPITIEMAERAINDISTQKEKVISADYIQDVVAKYFNINKKDLKSSKRSNDIAYPRQIAMYLCREVAGMSFPKIGDEFGKRDHTTVMHGYNKIEKEIRENSNTKLIVESVKKILTEKK